MSQRILLSSRGISHFIKENGIFHHPDKFEITGEALRFIRSDGIMNEYPIVHCNVSNGGDWKGIFLNDQWQRIIKFLDSIHEQPVVMEFAEYAHTDIHENPEINITECVIVF